MWPSQHIDEWREYFAIEPFGAKRDNLHAAMITAAIVNVNRAPRSPPVSADDFMFRSPKERDALARRKALQSFNSIATLVDLVKTNVPH